MKIVSHLCFILLVIILIACVHIGLYYWFVNDIDCHVVALIIFDTPLLSLLMLYIKNICSADYNYHSYQDNQDKQDFTAEELFVVVNHFVDS